MDPEPDSRTRFTPANRDELKAAVDAYIDGDQIVVIDQLVLGTFHK